MSTDGPNDPVNPDLPNPEHKDQLREVNAQEGVQAERGQVRQRQEIRLDMMRSIVTEPLLSEVTTAIKEGNPTKRFDVIISINELFQGGLEAAMGYVKQRAKDWGVQYYP